MKKQRVISGAKPTGRIHLGNYFGMIKQVLDLQKENEVFLFIADYHALINEHDPKKLSDFILNLAIDYLAIGLDPKKSVLFQQSRISAHTELAWILECLMPYSEMLRAHAYKEGIAKGKKITGGLFSYPILMAADILLYDANLVPVGGDQKQHVETASDLAKKFNNTYGETFVAPKAFTLDETATVPGLVPGEKMGKSDGGSIEIFEETDVIRKKVFSIQTGSEKMGEPLNTEKDVLFAFHKLFATPAELAEIRKRYETGTIGYKESKEILFERVEKFIKPLRERRKEIAKNPGKVLKILEKGTAKASKIANAKLLEAKKKIGVL
jgi:tryptophanyl-tRNA synthetase